MPEESTEATEVQATTETEATNTESTETEATESTEETAETNNEGGEDEEEVTDDITPERARKLIEKSRRREANYRTQLRDAEAALKALEGAKTLEEFQKAQADWESQLKTSKEETHALLVENVIATYDVPEDLVEFITGETREELVAKAQKLANHGGGSGSSGINEPDGGLNPQSGSPTKTNPGELAKKHGRWRR